MILGGGARLCSGGPGSKTAYLSLKLHERVTFLGVMAGRVWFSTSAKSALRLALVGALAGLFFAPSRPCPCPVPGRNVIAPHVQ